MEALAIVIALCLVVIFVRVLHPADLRVNKKYLGKVLKDQSGNGPSKMRSKRLELVVPPGTPEERVYYAIDLEYPSGEKKSVLALVFYPLEVYFAEKEKRDRANQSEDTNINSMTSGSSPSSSNEMEKYTEDPFKDLSSEENVRQQKEAELAAEVRQLQLINFAQSPIFPKLLNFDTVKSIVITESIGDERLDAVLNRSSPEERVHLLTGLMHDLAEFHNGGKALAAQLLPGAVHEPAVIRTQLLSALDGWAQMGAPVSPSERQEIDEAAKPLYEGIQLEMGPKMGDGAPRGFFVRQGKACSLEWSKARRDVSLLDVIEVVCDPAAGLDFDTERRLFVAYVTARSSEQQHQSEMVAVLTRLAVYYRIVLVSYLGHYLEALRNMSPDKRKDMEKSYWPADSLPRSVDNLRLGLEADGELDTLRSLLEEKLDQLAQRFASA